MSHAPRATFVVALLLWFGTALEAPAQSATWLDPAWGQRLRLTVKPAMLPPSETLTDLTLLLRLDPTLGAVFAGARADGGDLVMTAGDGTTPLRHELVSFDPVSQEAELWFRADSLSTTSDTFYLYFDNPDTQVVSNGRTAWSDAHLGVYHFEDDPSQGVLRDSGPAAQDAVTGPGSNWQSSDRTAGITGSGWNFDGIADWVYAENFSSTDSSYTISAWLKDPQLTPPGSVAFQSETGYWNASFQRSSAVPDVDTETQHGFLTWSVAPIDTLFHQYTWVFDGVADTAHFYFDGVEQPVHLYYTTAPGSSVYTGEVVGGRVGIAGPVFFNSLDLTTGVVDEFRILEGNCSAEHVATAYANQADPLGYFDFQLEDNGIVTGISPTGGGTLFGRIHAWPNPFRAAAEIQVELADPNVAIGVYDVAGRLVRTLRAESIEDGMLRMRWNGRDAQGTRVGQGIYYLRALDDRANGGTKLLYIR